MDFLSSKEKFEDMKEISPKSKEDRQCYGQKQKDKKYNDLQRTTQKTQDPATRILQKRWVIHVFQKG